MVSTSQKRKHIRVGANLVAKVLKNENTENIVYIKNVSAMGAKIESKEPIARIGETMTIKFKYKNVFYDIACKVVRTENNRNNLGVQFYFKGDNTNETNNPTKLNNNKAKLYNDILNEYFKHRES